MKSRLFSVLFLVIIIISGCEMKEVSRFPAKEGYINVTGGKVWFEIYGAEKEGTPIIIIHGGPGGTHDYLKPLEALADERPVIFYDQLGGGKSDRPSDTTLWTLDRFVEELEQVRTYLKLDKFHLLGQSWGGALVTEYYIKKIFTEKNNLQIKSIIYSAPLINTPLWLEDQNKYIAELTDSIQKIIKEAERTGDFGNKAYQNAMTVFYGKHLCRMEVWPDCLNQTFQNMGAEVYSFMWGPSEFTCTGILKDLDLTAHLSKIDVPVLYTCGEYDEAAPATIKYFQSITKNSEYKEFKNCSHSHHLENELEYINTVRSFLKKLN